MPATLPVLVGLVAAVAGMVLPRVMRSTDDVLAVCVVVLAVLMTGTDLARGAVVVAMALLVAWRPAWRVHPAAGVAALGAAALLLGLAMGRDAVGWLGVLTGVAVVVSVGAIATSVRAFGSMGTAVLLVAVPATAYGSVPDTEQVTAVTVALGLTVAVLLVTKGSVSEGGLFAFGALTVWAMALGAVGRPAAMVASLACFGVLAMGWMWWALARHVRWPGVAAAVLVVVHTVAGAVAARWAGLGTDVGQAATRALAVTAVVAAFSAVAVSMTARSVRA